MDAMVPTKSEIEKYAPRIFAKWGALASSVEIKPAQPAINSSFVVDRKAIRDDVMSREIKAAREEMIAQVEKYKKDSVAEVEAQVRAGYEGVLKSKISEAVRANRIINIQNAILARLYVHNKELFIKVIQEADITEDELSILAGSTAPEDV